MTDGALDQAQTTGAGQLQLQLELPLAHLAQSKVRGNVTLAGNALHFVPEAPTLSAARGVVQFDEHGFQLLGIQGQALGGTVRLEGGMPTPASALEGDSPIRIQAQGSASAQGRT